MKNLTTNFCEIDFLFICLFYLLFHLLYWGGVRGNDGMVVGFTTTYAISAYHCQRQHTDR